VWYRIVVKLSFARAKGRNYRQLPAKARLREKPRPADIFCSKRYSLSQLACKWQDVFFGTGVQAQRLLGFKSVQIGGKNLRCSAVVFHISRKASKMRISCTQPWTRPRVRLSLRKGA
jgi:hypothetical protein